MPKEVLACLKLEKGDIVFLTDVSGAVTITPHDPSFAEQLDVGREFMREYQDTFGFGLAKNHAFIDGNERVAFLSVGLFLRLHGCRPKASEVDATLTMMAVASGLLNEADFASWLRLNIEPRS